MWGSLGRFTRGLCWLMDIKLLQVLIGDWFSHTHTSHAIPQGVWVTRLKSCLLLTSLPAQVQLDWWKTQQQQPYRAFRSGNGEVWWGVPHPVRPVFTYQRSQTPRHPKRQPPRVPPPPQTLGHLLSAGAPAKACRCPVSDQHPHSQVPARSGASSGWTFDSGATQS